MKKTSLFFAITVILALSSCSIQKRHYLPGYSLNWNSKHPVSENKKVEFNNENNAEEMQIDNAAELTASIEKEAPLLPEKIVIFDKAPAQSLTGDSCDIIDFVNHQRILVKVLEIDQQNIKYKKCSDINAPEQIVSKSKVNYILFSNGLKEIMTVAEESAPVVKRAVPLEQKYSEPQDHISAKMSWIFGICAYIPIVGWIFALMAIIHGVIAITSINNKPEKYKGTTQAIVGIALGVLGLIAGAIVVLITLGPGFFGI